VGTGLIGGSVGMALRQRGWKVSGRDADPGRAEEAVAVGAIDTVGPDPDAEVVFVAIPATQAGEVAKGLLAERDRRPDVVVTDVSGVKRAVVAAAGHPRFIGGHPMAGSEQLGLGGAHPDLFAGATWVLTPTPETDLGAFARLREIVTSLGAEVLTLSPEDHDRLVAVVSHLPHLVAATLMNGATTGAQEDAALLRLAAGGFRDMTRVAAGHPGIWPDICADNSEAIVAAFDHLLADLGGIRDMVASADRSSLLETLERASAARRALPARAIRPENLSEVRVPVTDREGVLAEITSLAGDLGINIYDIEIAHSAEGPHGILLLVVDTAHTARLGEGLSAHGYRSTVRELS
jgi:prephenate dehydrogenase